MLVLTRRTGEAIIIGNGIKLTVVNIGPGRVKIGIEAPPNVRIDREEIHDRIQQEHATDVLDAVSSPMCGHADQATMVGAGGDTGILSSGEGSSAPKGGTPMPVPVSSLNKFRAPRKPR